MRSTNLRLLSKRSAFSHLKSQCRKTSFCWLMLVSLLPLSELSNGLTAAPAFSDADWVSLGGLTGTSGNVNAIAVNTNAGLVYVGGQFNVVGTTVASNLAVWNGTNWSALGLGVDGAVNALALDEAGNLYVGGSFTNAGGTTANRIAKWNGTA